jgi:hypothetical protein
MMAEDERSQDQGRLIDDGRVHEEERLRRYLLGLCTPKESAEVERVILAEFHPILDIIEDELIEDYVTGELSESDRTHFEERFLLSQERIEKIRLSAVLLGRPDVVESLSGRVENLQQKVANLQQKLVIEMLLTDELEDVSEWGTQLQFFQVLEERDRRLLREVYLKGRDKDEVCREFGVDPEYLRVLLHRVRQTFRAAYSRRTPIPGQQNWRILGAAAMSGTDSIPPHGRSGAASVAPVFALGPKRTGARTWFAVGAAALLGVLAVSYTAIHSRHLQPPTPSANLVPYVVSAEVSNELPSGGLRQSESTKTNSPPRGEHSTTYNSYLLTLHGSGFVEGSRVRWNGSFVDTRFAGPSELAAIIQSKDYETIRNSVVVVVNPPPGGGVSSPVKVKLRPAP